MIAKPEAAFARDQRMHDTTMGWRFVNRALDEQYGSDSMPETAENVAEQYGISREDQDAFALASQSRAAAAAVAGHLGAEIVAVEVARRRAAPLVVDADEHPRPQTSLEGLAALPAPFRKGGTVTAGNASGINDGACALIVASEDAAARQGLTPLARVLGCASAGIEPRIMGCGPVAAVPRLLARCALKMEQMDIIELNEAFAAQALAVLRQLGLADDDPRVNPQGGAIALGHPLGMSGARLAATATAQLVRGGGRHALCTMCVGVGQGIALALERV